MEGRKCSASKLLVSSYFPLPSELGRGLALLYATQRLQSTHALSCFVDSFPHYCTFSVTLLCLECVVARLGCEGQSGEETNQKCPSSLSAKCKVVITFNQGLRGGRVVELKKIVDEAVKHCPTIQHVLVAHRTDNKVQMGPRDVPLEQVGLPRFVQFDGERLLLG